MTYSIVAFDPDTSRWGVAVASKTMCVGARVPWGAGGVGAVATQSHGDLRYGSEGLALLHRGATSAEVVRELTQDAPVSDERQVGVVDADGRASTFTGERCLPWAGGHAGADWSVQGHLLAGPHVIAAMATTYTRGEGDFVGRLVAALRAGDEAGGDRRGRRSASVKVWRRPDVGSDRIDVSLFLRVDDAVRPVHDLERLTTRVVADPILLCGVEDRD
jgi:uncharacterized Ntn-hydrolase superfamily protein